MICNKILPMYKIFIKIEGITCDNCRSRIRKALLKIDGINEVNFNKDTACIISDKKIDGLKLINTINKVGYYTKEEYITNDYSNNNLKDFLIILIILLLFYLLINKTFGYNIFNSLPTMDKNTTYFMLFITGLLTSIHCVSMCGAIVFSASINGFKRSLLYNLGRLISYSLLGGVVGLIGSVFVINETLNGIIIIASALLMLLMSLSMLNIINFHLPSFKLKSKSRNTFLIGLLNGLMPCGPLQAMQVYALSTGSFLKGMFSMFLFCLGTIPLMLMLGLTLNILKGKKKVILNKFATVLIFVLSISMLIRGLNTLGIITNKSNDYQDYIKSTLYEDYQEVITDLNYADYGDIIVQKGIKVRLIINADESKLIGCNNNINIKEYNISKQLNVGENVIEFIPEKEGIYSMNCLMNMISNKIKVIDDIGYFKGDNE